MGTTVSVIERRDELERLRPEWDELLLDSDAASVYNSSTFALASWDHFDSSHSEPLVIAVRDGADLVGLAPLRLRRRRVGLVFDCVLESLGMSQGDRLALIVGRDQPDDVLDLMLDVVVDRSWSEWCLSEIDTSSALHRALFARFDGTAGFECVVEEENEALLTDISGTWEDFHGSHKRMRRNLRALEKAMPDHRVERFVEPDTIGEGLARLEALAAKTWKAGKVGVLKSDQTRDFYRMVLPKLVGDGHAGIRLLCDGDEVVASQLAFTFGPWVHFHSTDYNPAHESLSPGMMMVALTIKDLFEAPVTTVDYLVGYAGYMSSWATDRVSTEQLTVRRPIAPRSLGGAYRRVNDRLMARRRSSETSAD